MSKPLSFGGIHLLDDVDRLGDARPGTVKAILTLTSYFRADKGYSITLDPSVGLVTISHENGQSIVVPRERVKRFEPLPPKAAEDKPAGK